MGKLTAQAAKARLRWGPVATLADALDRLRVGPRLGPVLAVPRFVAVIDSLGRRPGRGALPRDLLGLAARGLALLPDPLTRAAWRSRAPDPPDPSELLDLITSSLEWLGARSLRYLAYHAAPFWREYARGLSGLAAVSPEALHWSLLCYALDCRGPGVGLRKALHRAADRALKRLDRLAVRPHLLDGEQPGHGEPEDNPGDWLSLHIDLETLVETLGLRLERELGRRDAIDGLVVNLPDDLPLDHLEMWKGPAAVGRRLGGLRTPGFLTLYPALVAPRFVADQATCGAWASALGTIASASPLTELVYPDVLVGSAAIVPARWKKAQEGLAPGTLAAMADWTGGPDQDFWLAVLARSVVAGLLSEPAGFEDVLAARHRVRAQEADAREWAAQWWAAQEWTPPMFREARDPSKYPPLVRARALEATVSARQFERRGECLAYVARLLGAAPPACPPPSGATSPPPGATPAPVMRARYLHLRALDLLVRQVVSESLPEIRREWLVLAAQGGFGRLGTRLFSKGDSAAFRAFQTLVLGAAEDRLNLRRVFSGASGLAASGHRAGILGLLTPPDAGVDNIDALAGNDDGTQTWRDAWREAQEFAKCARIPAEAARRLLVRFSEDPVGGVDLPFALPGSEIDERGRAPAAILSEWRRLLGDLVPAEPEEVQEGQGVLEVEDEE